jgi:hypothetical protein
MKNFVFGTIVGAAVMFFYINGFAPIVNEVSGLWTLVSRPPPHVGK